MGCNSGKFSGKQLQFAQIALDSLLEILGQLFLEHLKKVASLNINGTSFPIFINKRQCNI